MILSFCFGGLLTQSHYSRLWFRFPRRRANAALSRWIIDQICACHAVSKVLLKHFPLFDWQAVHPLAPRWRRMCFSKHLGFFVNESVIYNIVDSLIKTSWYDHLRKNRSLFWSYWTWKTKPHFANSLGQSAVLFGVRFRRVRRRRHNLLFAFNAYNLPLFWTQFNFFQFLHARTFPAHWSGRFWLVDILSAEASVHHVITALLLITFACQALSMKEKAPTACDILIG